MSFLPLWSEGVGEGQVVYPGLVQITSTEDARLDHVPLREVVQARTTQNAEQYPVPNRKQ